MDQSAFDPRHGESVPVGEGVRRITAPNSGPFTGAGTNSYLIGERELMLLDPGPDDPAHVAALLAAIGGRPVTHILLTHTHRDHVGAVPALAAATGALTVAEGAHRDARALGAGETNPFLYASDIRFRPDIVLADREPVGNAEVTLTAIATPGHTANHLAFGLGEICFSGDHVMGWSTTVIAPPDGAMGAYMRSLDRLLEERHARYLPGHGGPIAEPHRAVSAIRAHRLMRERAVVERIASGDRSIPQIVDALYAGLDPALRNAAELSVLAHLEKLEEEGRVAADGRGRAAVWRPA